MSPPDSIGTATGSGLARSAETAPAASAAGHITPASPTKAPPCAAATPTTSKCTSMDISTNAKDNNHNGDYTVDDNIAAALLDEASLAFNQKKHEKATFNYSQVAEYYSCKYGTMHPLYADIMFRYGRSLLARAIDNSGIFGNLAAASSAGGKREKDLLSTDVASVARKVQFNDEVVTSGKVERHMTPSNSSSSSSCGILQPTMKKESTSHSKTTWNEIDNCDMVKNNHEEREKHDNHAEAHVKSANEKDGDDDENDDGEDDEEYDGSENGDNESDDGDVEDAGGEAEDLEIAFETLDVSRVLHEMMLRGEIDPFVEYDDEFDRNQPTKCNVTDSAMAIKTRLAAIHAALGDVCLESENFEQATTDYAAALAQQIDLLSPIDRSLAETHYKLALALEYGGVSLETCLEHLRAARKVLTDRHALLLSGEITKISSVADPELKQLDDLIPDLDLKIDDIMNQIENSSKMPANIHSGYPGTGYGHNAGSSSSSTGNGNIADATEIKDLNSLVKRRPLPPPAYAAMAQSKIEAVATERKRVHGEAGPSSSTLGSSPDRPSKRAKEGCNEENGESTVL